MKSILISEFMDEPIVDALRAGFNVTYQPTLVDDRPALIAAAADADALIVRNRTQVTAEVLDAGSAGLRRHRPAQRPAWFSR